MNISIAFNGEAPSREIEISDSLAKRIVSLLEQEGYEIAHNTWLSNFEYRSFYMLNGCGEGFRFSDTFEAEEEELVQD